MIWRALTTLLILSFSGCSNLDPNHGNLASIGQNCIRISEDWLKATGDKRKLDRALKTLRETNQALSKRAPKSDEQTLIQDLGQLEGALNMAQVVMEQGQNPARPSSLSEFPATDAVTAAVEQLRTDVNRYPAKTGSTSN